MYSIQGDVNTRRREYEETGIQEFEYMTMETMMTMARTESSYGAEKLSPRLETRIYATEIGIRRGFSNTNYHELTTNYH